MYVYKDPVTETSGIKLWPMHIKYLCVCVRAYTCVLVRACSCVPAFSHNIFSSAETTDHQHTTTTTKFYLPAQDSSHRSS